MVSVQPLDLPGVVTLGQNLLDKLTLVDESVNEVHWERENFLTLGAYLKNLVPIVNEVKNTGQSSQNVIQVLEGLLKDVENSNQLIKICTRKSRIYLLTHCRSVVKQLEIVSHSIGRTIGLIPLSAVQGLPDAKKQIESLSQDMQKAQYQVQETEDRILRTLDQDQDITRSDIAIQSGIVMDIARSLGVEDLPHNPHALKDQIELLRSDTLGTNLRSDGLGTTMESYDMHMIDVIGNIFDSWTQVHDHPSPSSEIQQRLHNRIEPLYEAFVCPLTQQVMIDPVTLETGQTYERSAIERWFKQCVDDSRQIICPMTGKVLESTQLKSSIALRNTIEEWTARNEAARIENARFLISTENTAEEDLVYGLKDLQSLVLRNKLNKYRIRTGGLIPFIGTLLKSMEQVRVRALVLLRLLAEDDDDSKESIAEAGFLRSTLKCLSRNASEERQEASALLYELSKSEEICEIMGATNGMIIYLVGITSSKSDNVVAVQKAEATLVNLERLDSNVRQMAENGRVQPLLQRLIYGSEEMKLEMTFDLANIPLTTEGKMIVAEQGSTALVQMLGNNQKLPTREAALRALRGLSTLESNVKLLLEAGVLPPLMRDLFMVGAAYVKMKEVCATVLANVVSSNDDWQNIPIDNEGNTLISEDIVHNLLHLISNTGPLIESKLLLVLVGLAASRHSVANLVNYIRSSGAIVSLIQFLEAPQDQLRVPAIRLLHLLSTHMGQELADGLRLTTRQLGTLVRLLGTDGLIEEQAAAAGLLANLPVVDSHLTRSLLEEGALPIVLTRIEQVRSRNVRIGEARYMNTLQEALVTVLARFTFTLDDRDVVDLFVEHELTMFFVALLQKTKLDEVQRQAAIALENLSTFTPLCVAEPSVNNRNDSIFSMWMRCLRPPPPPTGLCPIHGGRCSAKNTFCLVEAQALDPLVACLDHNNAGVVEAALKALATVLADNVDHARGVQVLHAANAIQPILDIMQEHRTQLLRQTSVYMVERILRNTDLAQLISVDPNVHTALVDALRNGTSSTKPLAEKSLRHLNRIPTFSAVFTKLGNTRPGQGQRPPGY